MRWYLLLAAILTMGVACGQSEPQPSSINTRMEVATYIPTPSATATPTPEHTAEATEASQASEATTPPAATAAPNGGQTGTPTNSDEVKMDELTTTPSGLQYRDLTVGDGTAASNGDTAVVHYTGWLLDGTKFDSSKDRNTPFEFAIGAGRVIRGWEEGVGSMNIGGTRELIIPPDLAYGDRGAGGVIPPGATLKFEVELLDLK